MIMAVCTEYYPRITHSESADCKNCKYNGYYGCTNVNVVVALTRAATDKRTQSQKPLTDQVCQTQNFFPDMVLEYRNTR